MSEAALTAGSTNAIPETPIRQRRSSFLVWFIQALPFLVLGVGAVVGMAATTVTGQPKRFYWEIYTPFAALVCVLEGWRVSKSAADFTAVLFTQVFQWLAVAVALYLLMLTSVRAMMNDDSVGLALLTIIALSVFTAGIHLRAWRLLVIGAFLACTVIAIAFIEAFAILLMAGVFALLCLLGLAGWFMRNKSARV